MSRADLRLIPGGGDSADRPDDTDLVELASLAGELADADDGVLAAVVRELDDEDAAVLAHALEVLAEAVNELDEQEG